VVVAPIAVPLPDGKVKVGAAASEPADEPDHIPVQDKPAHAEKAAHAEKSAQGEKLAHGDKAAADKKTKLAAAAATGKQDE
jgi:hypothetical protein